MRVAIIGSFGRIKKGDLLRLEKDKVFNKVNVIKPCVGAVGVLSALSYNDCVKAEDVLNEFHDCTYVTAQDKEGIFFTADVIVPVDFTYSACKREFVHGK